MNLRGRIKNLARLSRVRGKNLLESPTTRTAHIEFTSRCNLRCVFCCASQPGYKGFDLDEETLELTIETLKTRHVEVVTVNGHGETTIYKNWDRYCNKLLDIGMPLHIISNFSKEFSQEELNTLSRFESIEVSCDTSDPALFKQLRRGADLKTLCLNILRLRAISEKEHRKPPDISLSCVVHDKNIFHLEDFVCFGKALGATHFNLCNLTKYPDLNDALNPGHITGIPVELLPKAEKSLMDTFEFLQRSNIEYHFQKGLLDSLRQEIQASRINTRPPAIPDDSHDSGVKENSGESAMDKAGEVKPLDIRYASKNQGNQTRDCLDPWEFIMIRANKDVLTCCWHDPIFTLGSGQSLAGVFNSTRVKALRKSLLTGDLSSNCLNCPSRGWTSVKNLQKKVWRYLNPDVHECLFPRIPVIKTGILKDFQVVFESGWFEPETNPAIEDPDWQTWRWAAKQACCKLENPGREALLILWGSLNKSVLENQTIWITMNDKVLDEFTPGTEKFFKEYAITPQMMGENSSIALVIETDNTFVPSELDPQVTDNRELGIQVYRFFWGEKCN